MKREIKHKSEGWSLLWEHYESVLLSCLPPLQLLDLHGLQLSESKHQFSLSANVDYQPVECEKLIFWLTANIQTAAG